MRFLIKSALVAGVVLAPLSAASAETIVGLVDSSTIVTFDSANPGVITQRSTLTGVAPGDRLTGIDLRPNNNQLYSVGTSGTVYLITQTGPGQFTATSNGTIGTPPSGNSFGLDFNPTGPVALREVSDTNQNLRITVGPPATVVVDTPITLNGSSNVDLVASAYSNNVFGATTTTLFGLDAVTDSLVRAALAPDAPAGSSAANNGTYVIVGPTGFTFSATDRVSFDISGTTGQGFFTINDDLFSINLATGAGTRIGALGQTGIIGITAAAPVPEPGTWAMMLLGFGAVGYSLRRKAKPRPAFAA